MSEITYYRIPMSMQLSVDEQRVVKALSEVLKNENPDKPYSRMIRLRLSGKVSATVDDTYFIAMDGDKCVSRLWYGWGRHQDSIGNFGNFFTDEKYRGKGIGSVLLEMLFKDLKERVPEKQPKALLCTSGQGTFDYFYQPRGFRKAFDWKDVGPLYKPVGDSPDSFADFCQKYYADSEVARWENGGVEYRHEIDCLLSFARRMNGGTAPVVNGMSYEEAVLAQEEKTLAGTLKRAVNAAGHTLDWTIEA